jgi:hypothetical protein
MTMGRTEESLSEIKLVQQLQPLAVFIALNDHDKAFELLDTAYQDRDNWLTMFARDPRFDEIREDPRYIQHLNRLDLNQYRAKLKPILY